MSLPRITLHKPASRLSLMTLCIIALNGCSKKAEPVHAAPNEPRQ